MKIIISRRGCGPLIDSGRPIVIVPRGHLINAAGQSSGRSRRPNRTDDDGRSPRRGAVYSCSIASRRIKPSEMQTAAGTTFFRGRRADLTSHEN